MSEKLKKFEEEEKQLIDMNKEATFDLRNLEQKIEQLRSSNAIIQNRINSLKDRSNDLPFITSSKEDYVSPYKF